MWIKGSWIIFLFLCFQSWGYSQDSTFGEDSISWNKYELNSQLFHDLGKGVEGAFHLAEDHDGELIDSINQAVVQLSGLLMFEVREAEIDTADYQTLFYSKKEEARFRPSIESSNPKVFSTSVFIFDQILSYSVSANLDRTKRPDDQEFINFNLELGDTIHFDDLLRPVRSYDNPTFDDVLMNFVLKNKQSITDDYFKGYLKDWGDIYARAAQRFYRSDSYNHDRVTLFSGSELFSHFDRDGLWFNVKVRDFNFLDEEKRDIGGSYVYEYQVRVKVPYQLLDGFLEEENSLYPVLKRLMEQQ